MRKILFATVLTACLAACWSDRNSGGSNHPEISNAQGGVDVGNMTLAAIPQTYASMSYPSSWSSAANENLLSIQNRSGSVIVARRSEIKDLSSPSAVSIQQYMKARYPDRTYNIIYINGLEGIRADLVDSEGSKQSDIYLVSELKDFIHIKSDLKKEDNGIKSGDQIILTVGVEYKGVPYPNSQPKKVTVPSFETFGYRSGTYSMLGDCYTYVDSGCKGVSFVFANGGGTGLSVGRAGYDHGRLIELGPESQVPFDEIKIEGKYLLAPVSKVLLSDIYTVFTPENPQQEQDSINLKEGYVYLVRTISWPSEDLISKIRVDRIEAGKSLTVTYSKLAYVEPKELQKQVEIINKYTLEREKPLATGEVTLYNRSFWNNYFFASFNFEFSTSGNMFITHNGWDLLFGNGGVSKPTFTVPFSSHSFGQVIDTGSKDLDEITLSDYPDPNTFERKSDPEVIVGHTYIVYQYDYEGRVIYGAVRVLALDLEKRWVRLRFRRLTINPADYFQNWIELGVPHGIQSITLEAGDVDSKSLFYPFINKRGDEGSHYLETMYFFSRDSGDQDYFSVDSRPYGSRRGFFKLDKNTSLESVTQDEVEALRGEFEDYVYFQKGDVIALLLENYFDKTLMVIRVDEHVVGQSVKLSMKYIYRAKTAYSEDRD